MIAWSDEEIPQNAGAGVPGDADELEEQIESQRMKTSLSNLDRVSVLN